jgi:hypothetical protein
MSGLTIPCKGGRLERHRARDGAISATSAETHDNGSWLHLSVGIWAPVNDALGRLRDGRL